MQLLLLTLFLLPLFHGFVHLPEHARSGIAGRKFLKLLNKHQEGTSQAAQWFNQRIDHFDRNNTATFRQRFYVESTFWQQSPTAGPIFVNIGGEGPETSSPGGFVRTLGSENGALLVTLEHRYYGQSVPIDLRTPNMKFLSTQQALADVASFIQYLNATFAPSSSKTFFTFGGSYSGALSAFFRLKYPHLTAGSLSSSGVVNAIYQFTEFDVAVREAIGTQCASLVQATTKAFEIEEMAGRGKAARGLFGMAPTSSAGDFFYMMADSAAMASQYGHKELLCNAMNNANPNDPNSLMQTFANFTNSFWGSDFGSNCFYDTYCLINNPTQWQPTSRAWRWQKCSELAYFQSAPSNVSLRSQIYETITYDMQQCNAIFGPLIAPMTAETNLYYGGADIQATKVFYSNFHDDPWHRASVRKMNNQAAPFLLISCPGCGHCQDLHSPSPTDPPELTLMRSQFRFYLSQWLSTP